MGCRKLVEIDDSHESDLQNRALVRRLLKYPLAGVGSDLPLEEFDTPPNPETPETVADKNTFFLSTGRRHRP